jgi:hypothetical protein
MRRRGGFVLSKLASIAVLAGTGACVLALGSPRSEAQTPEQQRAVQREIDELRRLIEQQQRTIGELQDRVEELRGQQAETRQQVEQQTEEARRAVVDQPLITSSNPRVRVGLSGQVDRLVNLADDGKSTNAYFVDNNVSVSRIRVTGAAEVTEEFTIGTDIELAISPNNSAEVSQTDEEGGQRDEFRKTEAIFTHRRYGEVFFGKGDPATKDIARIDLSGTDVLAYASTGDPAGGLFFREDGDGDDLTDTTVNDVFTDFDAGRENRVRYDTPEIRGFTASGSYGADQQWGAALRWAGTGHGVDAAAGLGASDPSADDADAVYAGSASVLHQATGLNLTYGTGYRDQDEGTGQLQYVKAGWLTEFFDFGETAFSVDFGLDKDTPDDGDEGRTVGLVALQNIEDYGTELFAGFRAYDYDAGDGPGTSTIYVGTAGTRIKF